MRITAGRALAIAVAVVLVPTLTAAQATQTKTNTTDLPWGGTFWLPCALDGAGETVTASGYIHFTEHVVIDGSGKWHYRFEGNPQGLKGTGDTSGETYNFTGMTTYREKGTGLPYNASFVNNFHIIGPGGIANSMIRTRFHVTIRPDGTTAVLIDYEDVVCK
jgi:hypothetical protein